MTAIETPPDTAAPEGLRYGSSEIDTLAWEAVFGNDAGKASARRAIRRAAASHGVLPASILPLYEARARGEFSGFTVPAINIRTLTYDTARAVFRVARRLGAGAFIFEIARSEIGYTEQRPGEYAAVVLAAAVREKWDGPVFIQGDHFQTNARKMKGDAAKEVKAIEDLILEAISASFFQIDIDTSTLVDLSQSTLDLQQKPNYENCAHFTRFIRAHQPEGVEISIGGEIGEVGKENSTPEELRAYMGGYLRGIGDAKGIAKVSIQTGSSHGGQVAPDGTLKRMSIDFDVIRRISKIAREEYRMAGAVQHGASTLPEEDFVLFPEYDTAEIHLATGFQNMVLDHPAFPGLLRETMYRWLTDHAADERKPSDSPEQFLYKTRKKALGPFKDAIWNLPVGTREAIARDLEAKFQFLFERLKAGGNRELVARFVRPVAVAESGASHAFTRDDEAGD